MITKVSIEMGWLIPLIIFGIIGFLVVAFFFLYSIFAILDWTYHERHRTKHKNKCPDKIERD